MKRPLAAALVLAAAVAMLGAAPRTTAVDVPGVRAYARSDDGALLTGIVFSVDAGLDREASREDGLAALVAESILQTPVAADDGRPRLPLTDAVDGRGASLGYVILPREVRFYLEGTSAGIAAAVPLVDAALQAPSFDSATLNAARTALALRINDEESDPRFVGRAMLRSSFYRGSAGGAALGSAATLARLGSADAQRFFAQWYRRGGVVLTMVGRPGATREGALAALAAALPAGSAAPGVVSAKSLGSQAKRIVTQRDVGAPYVTLGFAAPAFGERDFAATLVVRSLLEGVFDRTSSSTLPIAFRSVGALYDYETAPAHFVLWINGAQIDPEVGLAAVDVVVKRAAAKPLNAATLARYKESARGEWILETLTLEQRAAAIDSAVTRGLDPDTADQIAAAISRVSAADVQRVAKRYFQRFDVALVLPRSGGR